MNIVIASLFRSCVQNLGRYFSQVEELRPWLHEHSLRLIAAEGDSVDNTRAKLLEYNKLPIDVLDVTHGRPNYGSCEEPDRLSSLSRVLNSTLDAVRDTDDMVIYVESDLIWKPKVFVALLERVITRPLGFDVYAPMIMAGRNFYDIWGFRKNGERFGPYYPYHSGLNGVLTEVDSCGSCFAMGARVARQCRVRNNYALVGWSEDVRNHGYRIAVCKDVAVNHP